MNDRKYLIFNVLLIFISVYSIIAILKELAYHEFSWILLLFWIVIFLINMIQIAAVIRK